MGGGNVREQTSGQGKIAVSGLVTKDAKEREVIVEAILAENLLDAAGI
jgi:hypothetical protein